MRKIKKLSADKVTSVYQKKPRHDTSWRPGRKKRFRLVTQATKRPTNWLMVSVRFLYLWQALGERPKVDLFGKRVGRHHRHLLFHFECPYSIALCVSWVSRHRFALPKTSARYSNSATTNHHGSAAPDAQAYCCPMQLPLEVSETRSLPTLTERLEPMSHCWPQTALLTTSSNTEARLPPNVVPRVLPLATESPRCSPNNLLPTPWDSASWAPHGGHKRPRIHKRELLRNSEMLTPPHTQPRDDDSANLQTHHGSTTLSFSSGLRLLHWPPPPSTLQGRVYLGRLRGNARILRLGSNPSWQPFANLSTSTLASVGPMQLGSEAAINTREIYSSSTCSRALRSHWCRSMQDVRELVLAGEVCHRESLPADALQSGTADIKS